ncbi:MAG: hypothetical protein R3C01_12745 [Planctomycetaceae bacterium]
MEKLLGLRPRLGALSIKRTSTDSTLLAGMDRTSQRIKLDVSWMLLEPLLQKKLSAKLDAKITDPALRAIAQAALKESLEQGSHVLPKLLAEFSKQEIEETKASVKQYLVPLLSGPVRKKLELWIARELQHFPDLPPDLVSGIGEAVAQIDLEELLTAAEGAIDPSLLIVPSDTPMNLLFNQNIRNAPYVTRALKTHRHDPRKLAEALLKISDCPDIVEDRGHYFPTPEQRKRDALTEQDLRDLIEFLKTL